MFELKSFFRSIKPGIPKRYLLFVAGLVWTFAGGMLLFRGVSMTILHPDLLWLRTGFCVGAGLLFYVLMFSKISLRHLTRMHSINSEKPCLFSFFNLRGYVMMTIMIGGGIALRHAGIVPEVYLSALYIVMGIPLLLSAIRFYYNGFVGRSF